MTRRKRNDGVEQINTSEAVAAPRAAATMEGAVPLRSLLFVPGDDERKLAKALTCAADALILDLEDSVSPARKAHAREHVAELLEAVLASQRPAGTPDDSMFARSLWVRINPLDDPHSRVDLERVLAGAPHGIVLPKPRSARDVLRLAAHLDELEPRNGITRGATRILPIATETPSAVLALARGGGRRSGPDAPGPEVPAPQVPGPNVTGPDAPGSDAGCTRVAALTWGAEDLGTALGAAATVDDRGEWLPPYQLARTLCLLAAAAGGVIAIDTVYTDFRDETGLERAARAAKRDGFGGKLAIHPAQVDVLNQTFTPSRDELERARTIIAAFDATPDAGVVALEGVMLDRPHLKRARRVVAQAGTAARQPERKNL